MEGQYKGVKVAVKVRCREVATIIRQAARHSGAGAGDPVPSALNTYSAKPSDMVHAFTQVAHGEEEARDLHKEVGMLLKLKPLWGRRVPALVVHG
jgi:hypothetical protein